MFVKQVVTKICRHKREQVTAWDGRLWGPPSLLSNGYQELFPWG